MKFGETLTAHLTPEWRKQYISYSLLKQMIYNAVERAPMNVNRTLRLSNSYVDRIDEEFFQECEKELLKIETFFAEKLAEAQRKFVELRNELEGLPVPSLLKSRSSSIDLTKILTKRRSNQLRFVMSEYYLSLVLLQNYQTLNFTGFKKILKKHDKNLQTDTGHKWLNSHVEYKNFASNTDVKDMIEKTETIFTNYLEGGNRSRAMKRLRVPPFDEQQSPWQTFRLGVVLGFFICLGAFILNSVYYPKISNIDYENLKHLHRPSVLLTLFIFLLGINVYGWQKAGVNHVLIFEVDPRDHLTATHILEIASVFALFCSLSFFACLQSVNVIPTFGCPLLLTLLMLFYWFIPIRIQWSSRFWLMKVVGRIICAPFFKVGFADFWLADQLNSLSLVFADYEFFICFYSTNKNWYTSTDNHLCASTFDNICKAVIFSLPAWWRFAQSFRRFYDTKKKFPFLLNAGKYASTFPVNGLMAVTANKKDGLNQGKSAYYWCFIISRIFNTIYCFTWDILLDFGLFQKFTRENMFLRDNILYAPLFYYFAIVENFLLRVFWVFAIFLNKNNIMTSFNVATLGGVLEIIRRYIWNYIRLEHEHLNNVGMFRAVRDISITPFTASDHMLIRKQMDEIDGVMNRKERRLSSIEDD